MYIFSLSLSHFLVYLVVSIKFCLPPWRMRARKYMNGKLSHAHIVSIASADDDTLTTIQRKLKNSAEAMKRALHREVFSLLSFRSRIPWYPPVSPAAIMIIPLFVAPCCASSFFFVYLPFPFYINTQCLDDFKIS